MLRKLTIFFMWNTVLNVFLLIISSLLFISASDWLYDLQSTLFPIAKERFIYLGYLFIGLYKVLIFMFNLIPFLALLILGQNREFAGEYKAKEDLDAA